MEPRGGRLIKRYMSNFHLPAEANITEDMIQAHWQLERQLTSELLNSTPENRWNTFEKCYTRLYSELWWLNKWIGKGDLDPVTKKFGKWKTAIGPNIKSVYEIGSGTGGLISYLAENGFQCKGTEITPERGEKHTKSSVGNLSWGTSDGVNSDKFEPAETYDVVISNQVIEHLHPDDAPAHFKGVFKVLKRDGRYIMSTPHRFTGPHDVSRVFGSNESRGMHLKEYSYREIVAMIQAAGFKAGYYAFIPTKFRPFFRFIGKDEYQVQKKIGKNYLKLLLITESILALIPGMRIRYVLAKMMKKLFVFADNIALVAEKN